MCWREGRSCPPSLPRSPMASGDRVGWGDAGGGLGRRAFAGWVSKGRLTGEGSTMSSVTGSNVTQRHLLSTTTTSAASSSLCKSGA